MRLAPALPRPHLPPGLRPGPHVPPIPKNSRTAFNKSPAAAEMDDRLATIDMGRIVGGSCALSIGELVTHLTQNRMG